jgi:hypothetical protein
MGAVLGHGFHPLKARQRRSIPNLQIVHRQGRIPHSGPLRLFFDLKSRQEFRFRDGLLQDGSDFVLVQP